MTAAKKAPLRSAGGRSRDGSKADIEQVFIYRPVELEH